MVEVKERSLRYADVSDGIKKARLMSVSELLFCTKGAAETDFLGAWASGTNVYEVTFSDLIRNALPLIGSEGIKIFLTRIGEQLDKYNTQPKHRKAWKAQLDDL